MKKDVIISIVGRQRDLMGENNVSEFITVGSLYKKLDKYYLIYKESEETGIEGMTTVKIDNKRITITRSGPSCSMLIFEEGQKHLCHYDTGLGIFNIGVATRNIGSSIGETGGELAINYTLEINNVFASTNSFHITVKENKHRDYKPRTFS